MVAHKWGLIGGPLCSSPGKTAGQAWQSVRAAGPSHISRELIRAENLVGRAANQAHAQCTRRRTSFQPVTGVKGTQALEKDNARLRVVRHPWAAACRWRRGLCARLHCGPQSRVPALGVLCCQRGSPHPGRHGRSGHAWLEGPMDRGKCLGWFPSRLPSSSSPLGPAPSLSF